MKKIFDLLKKGLQIILKIMKTTTNLVLELGIEAVKATPEVIKATPEVIKATRELAKETLSEDTDKKYKQVMAIIFTTAGTVLILGLGMFVGKPLILAKYNCAKL